MEKEEVIKQTAEYARKTLEGEGSGHDWWHVYRVWKNAVHIAEKENADLFIVELAALLHDIADWKFHNGDDSVGPTKAKKWLEKLGVEEAVISHVCDIIKELSFKGAGVKSGIKTKEGMVVQDADRLDAMGAIGIARAFAYGGHKGREIYNPDIKPVMHESFEQYKNHVGTTVNHFYEKLLLLKDLMNTEAGKQIAEERHKFMEEYLDRFFKEWEGKA
ncbi:MAG: HD domain-containing protein [Nanoarchaeota archaeon]|nr:HD domain-containing protein [Nanoarchaeota archaeon]